MSADTTNHELGDRIWAHSGDSHFIEPADLWQQILPPALAKRMPWTERIGDDEERIHIDGETFTRKLPRTATKKIGGVSLVEMSGRAPGTRDLTARLGDLDGEGIWAEVVYSSFGIWDQNLKDPALVRAAAAANNEWRATEIQGLAPDRLVAVASIPMMDIDDAVAEARHAAALGLKALGLPAPGMPNSPTYNHAVPQLNSEFWDPLWDFMAEAGLVGAFHVGGDAGEHTIYRGRGGAILNYTNSTYSGQRAAMLMVASGALDARPDLKILVSEAGASWVPFLGERMNEGYRQHGMFVRPTLSRSPKEILYEQVYSSFQHENIAIAAIDHMGYRNAMFGSDYPHIEGTYGHTQKTLHELVDDAPATTRERVLTGAFEELFPHVSSPPAG
jgi:predicted TIM-barrel fold metal-dependent hydrolase